MEESNAATETDSNAITDDTSSVPDVSAVETVDQTTDSVESTASEETESNDLFYDIQGEQVSEATVLDWKKGGMLEADYTKKRQVEAKAADAVKARDGEVTQILSDFNGKISELEKSINTDIESIDWDYLLENDVSEYTRKKEQIQARKNALTKAQSEAATAQEAEDERMLGIEQQALLDMNPTWKTDPKQREADIVLVQSYVEAAGFTQAEYKKLTSAKLMTSVLKAAKYDELMTKTQETEKKVQKAPNVVKAVKKAKTKQPTSDADTFYAKKASG